MVATVKCYYNTGLTLGNCLDRNSLLDELGFDSREFPNIAIKQDRGLIEIRLNTIYDNIKDADYCKINDNCYWVTSIVMLNDNVAKVLLQQDYLTTVGVYGLTLQVLSGWCTRRHVLDDELFKNILDEPFTPTNELKIDRGTVITGSDDTGFYSVVLSTVDLLNITNTAEAYYDENDDKVIVPKIPIVVNNHTTYTSHLVSPPKTAYISLSNAYDVTNSDVQKGIRAVRQLGIESCIGASYMLPKMWANIPENNGSIANIYDKSRDETSNIQLSWGNYKNNKVYSGQFQRIVVFSLASGDSCENRVEDIVNPSTKQVIWSTYADTRYNGRPGCKPKWFKGEENTALLQAIHGAQWQQTPFLYNIASGWGDIRTESNLQRANVAMNSTNNMLNNLFSLFTTMGQSSVSDKVYSSQGLNNSEIGVSQYGNVSGMLGPLMNIATSIGPTQLQKKGIYAATNKALLSGSMDLQFPMIPNMADYVSNAFYDLRYRLSDNDMTRFDNFLSAYGYAVDEPLNTDCFKGRQNFNYVKADDVILKCNGVPQYLLVGMSQQIENGVRIWHVAPDHEKLINNPIVA